MNTTHGVEVCDHCGRIGASDCGCEGAVASRKAMDAAPQTGGRVAACDCASATPTYPVYRAEPHLPGCVWRELGKERERTRDVERACDDLNRHLLAAEEGVGTLRGAVAGLLHVLASDACAIREGSVGAEAIIAHARRTLERVPGPAWYDEDARNGGGR